MAGHMMTASGGGASTRTPGTGRLPPVQAIGEAPLRTGAEVPRRTSDGAPRHYRGGTPRRPDTETLAKVLGFAAVVGATIFVIWQLRPDLLFSPNMDVGGDNAGHVTTPYFLIHDLLPQGRITGWDPQWFEGFPLYVFYFPLPALFVAALSVAFPYAVAFKLVTVLGVVTLPAAAWAFGRLADFKRPIPALMAVAMLPFLFNTSYTIEGGNITSTLAGEFSFSLSLTTGLLFLGVLAYALRTGRLRWLAAALYGVTLLCHVVPALGCAAAAVALTVSRWDKNAWRVLVPVGVVGSLLAAFWLVPFAADLPYSSSMGYTRVTGLWSNILPQGYLWMIVPAGLGMLIAILRRDRVPIVLTVGTLGAIAGFQWLPAGFVYNGRWLPFYFLFTALLAAYGIGEIFRLVGRWLELDAWQAPVAIVLGSFGALIGALVAGGIAFPGFQPGAGQIEVPTWISWNYTGFQGKSGWPVYEGIVNMLDQAGRKYGCGRLQYEYITETNIPFGSTEATMALPYWTNGCMDTIDGVLFESSTTTPFHFLDQAEYALPGESSNPVSYLTYPTYNLADGIRHLQAEGVRYFLAVSPQDEQAAKSVPALVKIASTAGFPGAINQVTVAHPVWDLYLIKGGGQLVTPLDHLPVVETGASAKQWLDTNLNWWENERDWPDELALSGPANWPREPVASWYDEYLQGAGSLDPPPRGVPVKPTTVANVLTTNSTISFDVGRLGSPVLVRIPYFPNWHAAGALGPYEVSPNLMAVVPTSHHVTLTYGTTTADQLGKLASLGGAVGLGALITLRPPTMRQRGASPDPARLPDDEPGVGLPDRSEDDDDGPAPTTTGGGYGPPSPPPEELEGALDAEPALDPEGRREGPPRDENPG
jgi:hypothetical protein